MLSTPRAKVLEVVAATCALRYQRPDLRALWAPAGPAPKTSPASSVEVGLASAIREGRAKRFDAFGRVVAVFRHRGKLCAIDDACPHRGGPLGKGDIEDGAVLCPLHGWAFDLETGCMRENAQICVKTYQVDETDGVVTLSQKT